MKAKRILFIVSLIVMFVICFVIMNRHYDELARYQYVTNENREVILAHLDEEDINYMINQQLKPEQFLPFIEVDDFQIENAVWYTKTKEIQDSEKDIIVSFVNDFRTNLEYSSLETLLKAYSYDTLRTFFEEDNEYVKNANIVMNPAAMLVLIHPQESLYTYEPKDLVSVGEIPHVSIVEGQSDVLIKQEVLEPLNSFCTDVASVNNQTCGNLILTAGYISYEDQIPLYEKMMLKYGKDNFQKYWSYPGQSEYQLGYTVRFQPVGQEENKIDTTGIEEKQADTTGTTEPTDEEKVATWIEENAYKYGFIVRYPKDSDKQTGKLYQAFTLRYVGNDVAKTLHDGNLVLDAYSAPVK